MNENVAAELQFSTVALSETYFLCSGSDAFYGFVIFQLDDINVELGATSNVGKNA